MEYRQFGRDTRMVSEVGLGCWQIGSEWGEVDDATAAAILDEALEQGVTFFDTADIYGQGNSELRIARFLKKHGGPDVMVATKLGRFPQPGWPDNFSLDVFRQHTEASLRRLELETLDLTQVHCPPEHVLKEGAMFDWLRTLKQEGKIQRFGVSVETMDQAMLCLEQAGEDLASLQIIFNIFRQRPIDVLFPHAKDLGVAIIVRLPLASGLLSGKFTPESRFPEDDHRNYNRDGDVFNVGETFAGLEFTQGLRLVERVRDLVPNEWTMSQFALRFCLDFDAVTTVIPGATRPEQVGKNASASGLTSLGLATHAELEELYQQEVVDHIRGVY